MDNVQVKKLEQLFDLTSHPGWIMLCEDMQERIEATKEGMTRAEVTAYQQGLANGHIKVYRELIALRRIIEISREQAKDEETEEASLG